MKARDILLAIALVTGLFSTSYASRSTAPTEDNAKARSASLGYNLESASNPNGLGMAGQPGYGQGAAQSDLVYCDKCGGWVHRSQVRMADNTTATQRTVAPSDGASPTNDNGQQ